MASNMDSHTTNSLATNAGVSNEDGSTSRKFPESGYLSLQSYDPPEWASHLNPLPSQFLTLAHRPTPIHRWNIPDLPPGMELYIKRDDLSGMELSGNKVRKLEFLLADALSKGADTLITIGGIQSNHCRATAVAARLAGLEAHLILRTSRALAGSDPGLEGNLLVERMVGARVHLVSKEEYAKHGSEHLGKVLAERLTAEGRNPYLIPVGGSNALGTWGYMEAVREIEQQLSTGEAGGASGFDDIAMACGSGGTSAGLALGVHLSSLTSRVHAYSVCDSPGYFYDYIQGLLDGVTSTPGAVSSNDLLQVIDVKGAGYAISTEEELQLVQSVAQSTGIVLDPVYSGKALKGLLQDMRQNPDEWTGRRVLFVHTGGLLGMYDKVQQLLPMVGGWERMAI
ncbi:unnamed protein product [Closterium sp. Yama58-4]|nr:unnamed protein product [Closterium sp. Yama58-4]